MKRVCTFLLSLMFFGSAAASEIRTVVSINPIHGLVASVMDGIATPELLIKGADTLHGYQVKPSDAELSESADVIIWIGPTMESTLIPHIANLREKTAVIEVGEMHGLRLYETREHPEGAHGHRHEEHEEEHDAHGDEHEEEHEEHGKELDTHGDEHEEHEDEHGHMHGRYDMHIWLDTRNAKVIAAETAEQLAEIYPQHKERLTLNASRTIERLDALETELHSLSESFSGSPYVVFHDAYQYLEKMLELNNVGTIVINPEISAGAKRLAELRETISETGASCVFKEPQFDPNAVEIVAEGTDLKISTLDPLGADVEPGPNAYFDILRNIVLSLKDCLG